ncbi:uncharacterized protein LOC132037405 isoform X2 [Lycium ferocissimum]|uniref:uncharacterized protein LOC132037405 isoform X2 n=1 Tax=Lycium ferocissimum TaxID=112874 RepID=UPI002815C862|nr:uncharacterized protein LOC132037405 isoform X2 [Lycium ferocissimum]
MEVGGYKKVMVAIDESESSYYTIKWVLENLQESIRSSGNPLVIFMAEPRPNHGNTLAPLLAPARMYCNIASTPEFVSSVQERNHMVSVGILEKAKSLCCTHGIDAETCTIVGEAREAICDAVQKLNISLLILGDHGTGKLKKVCFSFRPA